MSAKTLKKALGKFLYALIGKHLPPSYSPVKIGQKGFRAFCGRLMLEKCGKNVNIEHGAVFSSKVELGDNSGIGVDAFIDGKCVIGSDVMMGPWCVIHTQNHRFDDLNTPMDMQGDQPEKPVYIGDDVWLGSRVTLLPGVHVGSHTIIGAGSVVTKDIPDYAIAAGNPARVKKDRREQ